MAKIGLALFLFLQVFISGHHAALDPDAKRITSAIVEIPTRFGTLQQGIVFRPKETELIRNSNFYCGPQTETYLGTFTRKPTRLDRASRGLLIEFEKRSRAHLVSQSRSTFQNRYKLNHTPVSLRSSAGKTIARFTNRPCNGILPQWQAKYAVRVNVLRSEKTSWVFARSFGSKVKSPRQWIFPANQEYCQKLGSSHDNKKQIIECQIEGFGRARLAIAN